MTTGEQLLANSSLTSGTALQLLTNPSGVGGGTITIYGKSYEALVSSDSFTADITSNTFTADLTLQKPTADITTTHEAIFNDIIFKAKG